MGTDLKNKINDLSPAQLKELMKKLGKEKKELPHMPRNAEQEYPVNSAQKRMWFLSKLDPESYLYTNPIGIRVKAKGNIDIDLFVKGFGVVAHQHEIMRTSFFMKDGGTYQKIHNELPIHIDKTDLSPLSEEERELELDNILTKDGQTVIHIEDFPLFRFRQIKLSDREYVFIYTSHHIISDAWSSAHIFRSMQEIFERAIRNETIGLAEPKYQYIDYVYWEQKWLQGNEYQNTLQKWKQLIPVVPEPLNLPTDYTRPRVIDYSGALYKTALDQELVSKLAEFSKKEGVNLFHTLLAAFNIVLHKYSRNEEIVVGIPLANRKLKEFQQSVGMFLNTLPHRSSINSTLTFGEYLAQVKTVSQDMMVHQDLPFDKLIEALNPPRDTSLSPLFQVLFVFQNIPSMYDWDNLSVSPVKSDYSISKYDLNLWIEEVDGKLLLSMTCQTSLFRKEMMQEFLTYYKYLLNQLLAYPDKLISDLQLGKEQPQAMYMSKFDGQSYVHEFEQQVVAHPNLPALEFGDVNHSYASLNSAANRIANYLLQTKKPEDTIIGLLLNRSEQVIIALLGISKTGAAYLPLDPNLPQERLGHILKDAGVHYMITESSLVEKCNSFQVNTLLVDSDSEAINKCSSENPAVEITEDTLAYMIYTSGSTGLPKGVCIAHGQLLNYSKAIWGRIDLPAHSKFASISAIYTDLGNTQIFPALMHGGCVDLIPESLAYNSIELGRYMQAHEIDCLKIVPSHLAALLTTDEGANILPNKLLILGGERIAASLIITIRQLKPNLRILNHYGPTETTIGVLTHEIGYLNENDIVPLGKPLDNNVVLVCDAYGRPQQVGIPGELIVCGLNVGQGYYNQPETTAKYFYIDNNTGLRCYRTGDLCRLRADGNIEFLGRIDEQIKLRGYRIEPAEIEKALLSDPYVSEAVVILKEGTLVAYISGNNEYLSINALKESLQRRLPAYMMPGEFITLLQLPRLGSGKINIQELKKHDSKNKEEDIVIHMRPRDEVELVLAGIWSDVLKTEVSSINQNFFDAGGNSLIAIEYIAKVNKQCSANISISTLFENNTIASLATSIKQQCHSSAYAPLVLLRKGVSNRYLFLVHPAGGDVLSYYELSQQIHPSYHIYGLQADKTTSTDISVEEMATQYLQEINNDLKEGIFIFGGWSMGALVAYEMARQQQAEGKGKPPVIIFDQKAALGDDSVATSSLDRISVFGEKIDHLVGRKTNLTKTAMAGLSDDERSALFLTEFKKSNLVPGDLKPGDFRGFLDTMISHNEATLRYQSSLYDGRVLLVKASEAAFGAESMAEDYGWGQFAAGDFSIIKVPGNHISLIRHPYVSEVGKQVNQFLETI